MLDKFIVQYTVHTPTDQKGNSFQSKTAAKQEDTIGDADKQDLKILLSRRPKTAQIRNIENGNILTYERKAIVLFAKDNKLLLQYKTWKH